MEQRTDYDRRRTDQVRERIGLWRDQLINLARTNRLLHYRPTRVSTLEIIEPGPAEIISKLPESGSGGWRFYLPSPVEEGEEAPPAKPPRRAGELLTTKPDGKGVEASLRALDRRATQEFMDKGFWILYLGIGMLEWRDPDYEEEGHSPLLLLPVTLERANPRMPYMLRRTEDDPLINPALSVRLGQLEVKLPAIGDEGVDEGDPDALLALIERSAWKLPGTRVMPRVVLGVFSFHKEVMYRDLLDHEEQIAEHPLVRGLALGTDAEVEFGFDPIPEEELDEQAPPEGMVTILDADASQRQCIAAARDGQSFVMDGPPGTGKSQTIANMIAELMAVGKTVLFVSEKAAALDVVSSRLRSKGLSEYVLELHSHKATRREVAQELGRALKSHPRPPKGMFAAA